MKRSQQEVDALLAELEQAHGLGGINPDRGQLLELLSDDSDRADGTRPLLYVNLLRFYDHARYPAGHELAEAGMSGEQAYTLYGIAALAEVEKRGGCLPLWGTAEQLVIGETDDWDQVAVVQYPDREAFIDMIRDPDYQASLVHRTAGLEKTVVIITRSLLHGAA